MADEYISRKAAYKTLTKYYHHTTQTMHDALREALDRVPAADVAPVRHGRWIDKPSKRGYGMSTYCSCCGQHSGIGGIESNRHRAYCPNCGAKMDGEK